MPSGEISGPPGPVEPMPTWTIEATARGERYLVCRPLLDAGLPHAFTLRPALAAPGPGREGDPRRVAAAIGLAGLPVARPVQVHGGVVSRPGPGGRGTDPRHADVVIVNGRSRGAAVATADCVGAILHAPGFPAFAVIHAGWRGTLAGALKNAVSALARESGAAEGSFLLAIGPSIGGCCYEVGEEVADRYRAAFARSLHDRLLGARNGRRTLDIGEANLHQAVEAGLAPERIFRAGICTSCRSDLCCSFRREGARAGRMWALAGLPP